MGPARTSNLPDSTFRQRGPTCYVRTFRLDKPAQRTEPIEHLDHVGPRVTSTRVSSTHDSGAIRIWFGPKSADSSLWQSQNVEGWPGRDDSGPPLSPLLSERSPAPPCAQTCRTVPVFPRRGVAQENAQRVAWRGGTGAGEAQAGRGWRARNGVGSG